MQTAAKWMTRAVPLVDLSYCARTPARLTRRRMRSSQPPSQPPRVSQTYIWCSSWCICNLHIPYTTCLYLERGSFTVCQTQWTQAKVPYSTCISVFQVFENEAASHNNTCNSSEVHQSSSGLIWPLSRTLCSDFTWHYLCVVQDWSNLVIWRPCIMGHISLLPLMREFVHSTLEGDKRWAECLCRRQEWEERSVWA